ncbi:MAG: GLUG motif-containing protein [Synergistaceae bacterium]|nr:GLUG motif-containing protein [Synergistaceae bacterium]
MRPNADGVYDLATSQDLIDFREAVNAGSSDINAKLTADIDLGGANWKPIADGTIQYAGKFDGGGYTVSNYIITSNDLTPNSYYAGFFGQIDSGGTVSNLTVSGNIDINVTATRDVYAGGVAGRNGGSITNCANSGRVTGSTAGNYNYAGGVAGGNSGSITSCANSGPVSAAANRGNYSGGIAGGGRWQR